MISGIEKLKNLTPTQPRVTGDVRFIKGFSNEELEPITVVQHLDKLLMVDKHTTAAVLNERMISSSKIVILEDDMEFRCYSEGVYMSINSVGDFIRNYEEFFKNRCESAGVFTAEDLKIDYFRKRKSFF